MSFYKDILVSKSTYADPVSAYLYSDKNCDFQYRKRYSSDAVTRVQMNVAGALALSILVNYFGESRTMQRLCVALYRMTIRVRKETLHGFPVQAKVYKRYNRMAKYLVAANERDTVYTWTTNKLRTKGVEEAESAYGKMLEETRIFELRLLEPSARAYLALLQEQVRMMYPKKRPMWRMKLLSRICVNALKFSEVYAFGIKHDKQAFYTWGTYLASRPAKAPKTMWADYMSAGQLLVRDLDIIRPEKVVTKETFNRRLDIHNPKMSAYLSMGL